MSKQIETQFTAYEFAEEEYAIACVFTEEQRRYIQSRLAGYMMDKQAIGMDLNTPDPKLAFLIEHEHKRGMIEALQALLTEHELYNTKARQLLAGQAESQKNN